MTNGVTFVLCIENNTIRNQALLLIESIREFTGRLRESEILAISPRGNGVDRRTRDALRALGAHYVDPLLNTICPTYGSANRIYAGAWAAAQTTSPTLLVLDSDTVFLDEPILLGDDWDAAVRPVDVKGCTSTGPSDPMESYWKALCALGGLEPDDLPWVVTGTDGQRVRASYNGGYLVVRREVGVLETAAEIFTRSVKQDLRPFRGMGLNIFASTGFVGKSASELWGSNQAALSVALWSLTNRVMTLPPNYNIPLHLTKPEPGTWSGGRPVHVHYHWCFGRGGSESALETLTCMGVPCDRIDWLLHRLPLDGAVQPT